MRRRTKVILIPSILAIAGLGVVWLWWPKPDHRPHVASLSASISTGPEKIVVGKNVQVSRANAELPHTESVIAADPADPARLFVAAMYWPPGSKDFKLAGYLSQDGGATWHLSLERKGDEPEEHFGDPTVAFGPRSLLYLACIRKNLSGKPDAKYGDASVGRIEFLQSTDGGETWGPATNIPQYFDRPWIAVDRSSGLHRGRLYCSVKEYKPFVFVSPDQGRTFLPPLSWPVDRRRHHDIRPGNVVVLSDGTVVVHYFQNKKDPDQRAHIPVWTSPDGGASFQEATPVNTAWQHERLKTTTFYYFPQMAADTHSERRDRLYCVWEDGVPFHSVRIFVATSADKGRTWSSPLLLSEQPTSPADEAGYATFMPSVAVNRQGIVAVCWYDRRGLPKKGESGESVM